jgi:hypothetical protein
MPRSFVVVVNNRIAISEPVAPLSQPLDTVTRLREAVGIQEGDLIS